MAKRTDNIVRVEAWTVQEPGKGNLTVTKTVSKITVRNSKGQFHGATNFRGSRLN